MLIRRCHNARKSRERGSQWAYMQVWVLRPVWWDTISKRPYKIITRSFEGHLNIIGYTLRAIISGFIVQRVI
jgi:hypothetical protein